MDNQIKIGTDAQGGKDAGDVNWNICFWRWTVKGVGCRQQQNTGIPHTKRKIIFQVKD